MVAIFQLLYDELRAKLAALGGNKTVIFNGIRQGQRFAAVSTLLPHSDGGEMEGFMTGVHQRFKNGSLNPALMVPTLQTMINASRMVPPKQVLFAPLSSPLSLHLSLRRISHPPLLPPLRCCLRLCQDQTPVLGGGRIIPHRRRLRDIVLHAPNMSSSRWQLFLSSLGRGASNGQALGSG
jgi:hypothetical protein